MERIEKTLLLPLLAAAVLSSASCSDDKEKEPPVRAVNYTIEFSTVSQAVYLGDKYQTGEGNYRLTLTNADGDVLEADLTSVKAPKPSAAMPEAGVYTAAETRRRERSRRRHPRGKPSKAASRSGARIRPGRKRSSRSVRAA